jgi:hypothetical protein
MRKINIRKKIMLLLSTTAYAANCKMCRIWQIKKSMNLKTLDELQILFLLLVQGFSLEFKNPY